MLIMKKSGKPINNLNLNNVDQLKDDKILSWNNVIQTSSSFYHNITNYHQSFHNYL